VTHGLWNEGFLLFTGNGNLTQNAYAQTVAKHFVQWLLAEYHPHLHNAGVRITKNLCIICSVSLPYTEGVLDLLDVILCQNVVKIAQA
jgi:hypothetical protein